MENSKDLEVSEVEMEARAGSKAEACKEYSWTMASNMILTNM